MNGKAGTKVYGGRRGGALRLFFGALVLAALLLLAYLFLPFGTQRAVLLGSDARAGEASRADTIMVAAAGGQDGLLAVPRDTLVEVPGVGPDKVNHAFAYGGAERMVETLEGFTGRSIGNYLVIDFGGVEEIVDTLGGVTVYLEEPLAYELEGRFVSIPGGTQRLDGAEALAYVRYRGGPMADIGRIQNQQRFLGALAGELTSPSNLPRLLPTLEAIWRNVETNMNPLEAARFAVQLGISGGETPVEIYPGTPDYIDGVSYWVPDEAAGEQVVEGTIG